MSIGRKKNFSSAITIQFTVEEKKMLDEIARKDKRSLSGEIVWLIEGYCSGKLIDASVFNKELTEIRALARQALFNASQGKEPTREFRAGSVSSAPPPGEQENRKAH